MGSVPDLCQNIARLQKFTHLFHFILYLHKSHNAPLPPPPLPPPPSKKKLHGHCFRFLLGHIHVPGEIANNDYAEFWELLKKEVYYGICASRECKIVCNGNPVLDPFPSLTRSWMKLELVFQYLGFCKTATLKNKFSKRQRVNVGVKTLEVTQIIQTNPLQNFLRVDLVTRLLNKASLEPCVWDQ